MKAKKLLLKKKDTKLCAKCNLINKGLYFINNNIKQANITISVEEKEKNYLYIKLLYKENVIVLGFNSELIDEYLLSQEIYTSIEYLNKNLKKIFVNDFVKKNINTVSINNVVYVDLVESVDDIKDWIYIKVSGHAKGDIKVNCGKWLKSIDLDPLNKIRYNCLVEQYRTTTDVSTLKKLEIGDVILLNQLDNSLRLWELKNNLYCSLIYEQTINGYELAGDWYSNMSINNKLGNLKAKVSFVVDEVTLYADDLAGLTEKQYIKLDKKLNGVIDIYVNDYLFGKGELLSIDEHYGVKITELNK